MKYKLLRFSLLSILMMLWGTVFADQVTMKYPGETTSNMTGENDAALFGLVASEWSVIGDKGANNNMPGLNKAGDFRLYWSAEGGNTITVASLNGATINSIAMTFTGDTYSNVSVTVDGKAVSGANGEWTINSGSFVLGNANESNVQVRISEITINYTPAGGQTDTRAATAITLGDHATTAEVGSTTVLPTATVSANGAAISGAQVTWSSSNTDVVTITGNNINCVAAGTVTITATYAGDATNYKGSTASYTLTVTATAITIANFKELQEKATAASTPAKITFNGAKVLFINGSNAFLSDANGYGALIYTKNHGLEAGQTLTGTIDAQITLYQGNAEITNFTKEGLTIGSAAITPIEKELSHVGNANQSTLIALKGLTASVSDDGKTTYLSNGTNSIQYYDKFKTGTALEAGKTYDVTGIIVIYNNILEICPRTADDVAEVAINPEPAEFQDFAVIVNNQDGTLLTKDEQTQGTDISFGVAVRDGQTIRIAADDASSIATVSGKFHSEHGMTNLKVVTAVPGPVKILVGQCTYSSKQITVTNAAGDIVATATPATACWKNDRSNMTELVYDGEATTLTITGMDYCPFVAVKKYVAPAEFQDFAAIVNNQDGTLLTSEETATQYSEVYFGVAIEDGKTIRVAADDAKAIATISGKFHSEHGMTGLKVVTAVPGPVKILVGQCTYSSKDIKVTNAAGELVATATPATACWKNDPANVTELIYKGDATTLTITGMDYCPFIAVQKTEVAPEAQDITGTWDFGIKTIMEATMAFSGSSEAGEVEAAEKNGLKMIVEANGASFRDNGNNIQVRTGAVFKIPVRAAGDLITVKGYPSYSYYTIGNSTEELNNTNEYKAKISDAEAGYVAVKSVNDNNYYYSISVVQYAQKEKITLDNEAATVTFAFNEGTEGQKAAFSNADYFLSSKVTYGSNLTLKDKNTLKDVETEENVDMTRFEPATKLDTPDEQSAVRFVFTPKPGFSFKPTKVSLKASRFGTDNGLIDVTWEVANGENLVIATAVKPERNNKTPNISKLSYDITDAAATEGPQTLLLHLYSLQEDKQFGVSDIVIEGIMNGTEKDVPVLASFKVNGNTYAVEDVFGELYEATLKLPKTEAMVSKNNPLTDVTASSGTVGELTYDEKENACTVTIPMTAGDTQMDYTLNVIFKPDYKLEYIGIDGSVLATQTVEEDATIGAFGYDINNVQATKEGYKARGWFKKSMLGEKFSIADVITANTKLYAIQTEIEEASTHKKYNFDLTDQFFYAEDHEAFNPAGEGFYWHDKQHGWAFKPGNTVDLLVGPKATVTVTLCQYGYATGIDVKKDGQTLATLAGMSEGDGGSAVLTYEGTPGTITLEMQGTGEMYIHGIKIVNTAEVNFESQGNWYFVKAGDAGSLIDVLDVVNGKNASKDAERAFIFLPNGTYDLDATVKTTITGHNISIIGQSMDGTIIMNKPDKSIEGLGSADLFDNSGSNLYLQDLTLKNALDYYNAGSAGRAAVLVDAGTRTIGKNVRMLSYQDTYWSSNASQQAYWETSDIHGTVDFICGGGDIRFQNTILSLEPRAKNGSGSRTIVAPTTNTQFGYVFDGCKVVDLAEGKGNWNFGRTWQNEPICVYLNTTLDKNAENTIIDTRWIPQGMNNKDPKLFGEYGTKDENGKNITPASNILKSYTIELETILSADQAAAFAYDKMFTDWDPAALAKQIAAPDAKYENGKVTFVPSDNGMTACALFKNGEFVAISEAEPFIIDIDPTKDALTIRRANMMGGFGPEAPVAGTVNSISTVKTNTQQDVIYNLQGVRVSKTGKGLYIINGKKVVIK